MLNQPGYPLPSGEAYTDDIVCQLVYLPNRPEYWRALLAALHYFATWKAWERDDDHRGADAARAWRESFELTLECWRMTCLNQLQEDVANIFVLLRDRKDCCDDNITYGPQTEVGTEIEPEVGDPPDYYGETAVTDWDDWLEHVCHNAHLYVDSLVWQATEMNTLLTLGGVGIGFLGAALVLLSFVGVGLAVTYALVAATAAGILELGSLGIFLTTADDIEDARNDIVCSLLWGNSLSDAVETALGSASLDWLSFFSQIDYESATAIIYEGGYESEYLPADTRDDCECVIPGMFAYTFVDPDKQGWNMDTGTSTAFVLGGLAYNMATDQVEVLESTSETGNSLASRFSISTPVTINYLRFRFRFHTNGQTMGTWYFHLRVIDQDSTVVQSAQYHTSGYAEDEWHEIEWYLGQDVELRHSTACFGGRWRRYQSAAGGQRIILDDIVGAYV